MEYRLNPHLPPLPISVPRYHLHVDIPGDGLSANKLIGRHYGAYARKRDELGRVIRLLIRHQLPPKPLDRALIRLIRFAPRMKDYDGLVTSMKSIVDALKGPVLIDDRWSVTGAWLVDQYYAPEKEKRISLEVFEMLPGEMTPSTVQKWL